MYDTCEKDKLKEIFMRINMISFYFIYSIFYFVFIKTKINKIKYKKD